MKIYSVKQDLRTIEKQYGNIFDKDIEKLIYAAHKLNLALISTIDPLGITVINCLQIIPLKKELILLHGDDNTPKVVLDLLDHIVRDSNRVYFYIKFVGGTSES